jgi:DNA-binding NarL/FixJ family response regulator
VDLAERAVAAGDRAGERLVRTFRTELGVDTAGAAPVVALTPREMEVARRAANGVSDRDIATELDLSVRTVEGHQAAAYRKLAITNRRALRDAL